MSRHFNEIVTFKPSHLERQCPACRAAKGSRCRSASGEVLKENSHLARAKHHQNIATRGKFAAPQDFSLRQRPNNEKRKIEKNTEKNTRRVLHRVRSKRHPRYGQVCEMLTNARAMSDVQVRFEDGTTEVVHAGILRVVPETERWRGEK